MCCAGTDQQQDKKPGFSKQTRGQEAKKKKKKRGNAKHVQALCAQHPTFLLNLTKNKKKVPKNARVNPTLGAYLAEHQHLTESRIIARTFGRFGGLVPTQNNSCTDYC